MFVFGDVFADLFEVESAGSWIKEEVLDFFVEIHAVAGIEFELVARVGLFGEGDVLFFFESLFVWRMS